VRVPASFDGPAVVFWVVAVCAAGFMAWLEWSPERAAVAPAATQESPVFVDLEPLPRSDANLDGGDGSEE
jgi:hypothetical protein